VSNSRESCSLRAEAPSTPSRCLFWPRVRGDGGGVTAGVDVEKRSLVLTTRRAQQERLSRGNRVSRVRQILLGATAKFYSLLALA